MATGPIENLDRPELAPMLVAGGRQTKGALPAITPRFEGAVYSSRGRGYARYNEDGAGLYTDRNGALYASVFDQAGGLGGSVRGAASELAARAAFDAFRELAMGPAAGPERDEAGLRRAIDTSHQALLTRGEGEVTTAVLLVAREKRAIIVNSGDSAAMHFNAAGQLRAITEKHEVQSPAGIGCLVHAVGLAPEGPAPDCYRWTLETGDWVLMGSDGLLDAGLSFEAIGAILAGASNPENAVNTLARQVLRRMTVLQAKPDNLTVVAVRARIDAPTA